MIARTQARLRQQRGRPSPSRCSTSRPARRSRATSRRPTPPSRARFEHAAARRQARLLHGARRAGRRSRRTATSAPSTRSPSAASSRTTPGAAAPPAIPTGLADGVTWIFGDRPAPDDPARRFYSKINGRTTSASNNWSAARDSITDFNNNSRGVQGGAGFARRPAPSCAAAPNPAIFDHGISQGASEALDIETTWVQTVRPLNQPQASGAAAGAARVRRPTAPAATAAPSGRRAR